MTDEPRLTPQEWRRATGVERIGYTAEEAFNGTLPYDRPWTDEEKEWVLSWNRADLVAKNEADFEGRDLVAEPPPAGQTPDQSPQARSALDPDATLKGVVPSQVPQPSTVEDDYDDWKVGELRKEASDRGIEGSSKMDKPSAIASLRAWDAEHPDAAEQPPQE